MCLKFILDWQAQSARAQRLSTAMPGEPVLAGVIEVLLRIDLDIAAGGIDVREGLAGFDHLLEQQDLVGLFEDGWLRATAGRRIARGTR